MQTFANFGSDYAFDIFRQMLTIYITVFDGKGKGKLYVLNTGIVIYPCF